MSSVEWLVAIAGVALIAWINWYFFLASQTGPLKHTPTDTPKDTQ
ncbi:hypothetical protein [Gemmatimonas sp.]